MSSIIQSFHEGGIFMYFILLFAIFTIALIVERSMALYIKIKEAPSNFREQVLSHIQRGDLAGAENYANTAGSGTGLGRIAAIGCHLRANAGGEEELQARMDESLSAEISSMDRRTGFLAMFGNVSTLLGLLGTISGMIHSFAAVASANPADRATMLSRGISEAMNCTAFGLIVAIPALVAYAVFQNKTDKMISSMTEATTQIFHDLLFLSEPNRAHPELPRGQSARNGMVASSSPSMTV